MEDIQPEAGAEEQNPQQNHRAVRLKPQQCLLAGRGQEVTEDLFSIKRRQWDEVKKELKLDVQS